MERSEIERVVSEHGCDDFQWIDPREIVLGQWVRLKCRYGCPDYGRLATCPPNNPSVAECMQLFSEYSHGMLFHFRGRVPEPEARHRWTRELNTKLIDVESAVFLLGNHKAFSVFVDPCNLCKDCVESRADCRIPDKARPSLEGLGVDVFATARNAGYEIDVLTDYRDEMNRFGLLLVE